MRLRGNRTARKTDIANAIYRQTRRKENTTFLRCMPQFRVQETVPAYMNSLLFELDQAERRSKGQNGNAP
ncbi:hypothetical protein GCM10023174_11690 [Chelativorans composti]|jgi:hypothetical protein